MMQRAFTIAWRNIRRHRRRTRATLTAMVIGIGAVIAVRGLMNSTQQAERDTVILGRYGAIQIFASGYRKTVKARPLSKTFDDSVELRAKISAVPGVTGVAPRLNFTGMIKRESAGSKQNYVTVIAVDPESERSVSPKLIEWVTKGRFLLDKSAEEVLVTDPEIGEIGSQYVLSALTGEVRPNHKTLTLVGRINKALPGETDVAILPLSTAQNLIGIGTKITAYAVAVADQEQIRNVTNNLSAALGANYEVVGWWELFPFIDDLQNVGRSFFDIVTIIFICILLVAVANTLLSRVMERRTEIGTMLATGIPASFILLVFTLEGTLLAALGASSGAALGVGGVAIMNMVGVPFTLPGGEASFVLHPTILIGQVVKVIGSAVLGGFLTSLWPALRASRLNPIDALRGGL